MFSWSAGGFPLGTPTTPTLERSACRSDVTCHWLDMKLFMQDPRSCITSFTPPSHAAPVGDGLVGVRIKSRFTLARFWRGHVFVVLGCLPAIPFPLGIPATPTLERSACRSDVACHWLDMRWIMPYRDLATTASRSQVTLPQLAMAWSACPFEERFRVHTLVDCPCTRTYLLRSFVEPDLPKPNSRIIQF